MEEDLKKSKIEIEQQKTVEQYLRNQINYITKCDKAEKLKLEKLQQDNESLLLKYVLQFLQKKFTYLYINYKKIKQNYFN